MKNEDIAFSPWSSCMENLQYLIFLSVVYQFKFNFFRGIPFLTKACSFRISAIADELSKGLHDVVALQEVFVAIFVT